MLLVPGEVLEESAELGVVDDPQVHLDALAQDDSRLLLAVPENAGDVGQLDEGIEDVLRVRCGTYDIDVADGLLEPAEAPRGFDADNARTPFLKSGYYALGGGKGAGNGDAVTLRARSGDFLEDVFGLLRSHARERGEASIRSRSLKPLHRGHVELVPQTLGRFRPHARYAHDIEDAVGELTSQLLVKVHLAFSSKLRDLARDGLPDSGYLREVVPFADHLFELRREVVDRACGALVGNDNEPAFALDLEQTGDILEDFRDLSVVHGDSDRTGDKAESLSSYDISGLPCRACSMVHLLQFKRGA